MRAPSYSRFLSFQTCSILHQSKSCPLHVKNRKACVDQKHASYKNSQIQEYSNILEQTQVYDGIGLLLYNISVKMVMDNGKNTPQSIKQRFQSMYKYSAHNVPSSF